MVIPTVVTKGLNAKTVITFTPFIITRIKLLKKEKFLNGGLLRVIQLDN